MTLKQIKILLGLTIIISLASCVSKSEKFVPLFNGKNLDGWYIKIRSGGPQLANKVFAVKNKMVHVFDDSFPDTIALKTGENATHGMLYTNKKYSKFILRFEYKWGTKIANNFDMYQYDAGCYYHVFDDEIWPKGIEYQVRYNHLTNTNHTGDFWAAGATFQWHTGKDSLRYLSPDMGGIPHPRRFDEHLATATKNFNALNDKWNQCEVIVMGNEYAIHKLNGDIVNMATDLSVSEGKIAFQSETAEIFYRNIEIQEYLESIPMEEFIKKIDNN
ncbi:3-keto-disaccharide hydrolase [Seonamhaeicola maritimus]|uniref:3-keto-disaccharide hydrolase n=1 Tax=Seonamhaeicola maritimus TaxID=2591822 RepID=UPI002494CC8F|nr:DUF1080 domain-containing protein [Seonamhaeicola maritimus]